MFWVALATAIMMLSGEGDDVRAIAMLITGLRKSVYEHVEDESRRRRALDAVGRFEAEFVRHRKELERFGRCVNAVDRRYEATRADYAACEARIEAERARLAEHLLDVHREYEASLDAEDRARIAEDVLALPDAWVLDPTLITRTDTRRAPRLRGIEGPAARRHLTLPRNVVGIVYGPLGPATFGQRFPSRIVEAGTSVAHADFHGANGSPAEAPDVIATRLGCRFGLYDDIEGGAVFLPFELSPDIRFEPVLAYVTNQFRLDGVDLAFRFSMQTPGDFGWSVAPGGLLGVPGRRVAFQAGAFVPMELGSLEEQQPLRAGVVAPLGVTLHVVPALFVTAETAFAYDDLDSDVVSVPLGFGAGYTLLAGARLIELTASFSWDHFVMPARPGDLSLFQPEVFRAAFGASMYFQAL